MLTKLNLNCELLILFSQSKNSFQTNIKKRPKCGKIFDGLSTIKFARNNENGKYQHGFKYGKCIRPFKSDVLQIKGTAIDDKFEVTFNSLKAIAFRVN